MANGGATTWYFPDGYLPEKISHGSMEAHEALMLLNVNDADADVLLDIYYEDRAPDRDIAVSVPAERIACFRLDMPEHIGGVVIPPLTQYSIRVRSSVPLVCQFGRVDTTQQALAYYGSDGFCE